MQGWGGPGRPATSGRDEHGIYVDTDNVWIAGNDGDDSARS